MFKGFSKTEKPVRKEAQVVPLEAANAVTARALRSLNDADDKLAVRMNAVQVRRMTG